MRDPDEANWNPQTVIALVREWGDEILLQLDTQPELTLSYEFFTYREYKASKFPELVNVGMYYGSIILMSTFCVLLSLFNRDPDAWKLGVTVLAWAFPSFAVWGYGDTALPFNLNGILESVVNQLIVMASMLSSWFSINFLRQSTSHSKVYSAVKLSMGIQAVYLCSTFLLGISWLLTVFLILIPNVLGTALAIVATLNKDKAAPYLIGTSCCTALPFVFLFISPLNQQSTIAVAMVSLILIILALMQRMGERFHSLGLQAKVASERERFLASMSHEIRTPLNGIIGFSELCSKENLEGKVKDYFFQIDRSSKMLLGIVNDVLDYSKIQTSGIDLISESMSVEKTLKDVLIVTRPLADVNNVDLSYEISPDVSEFLITDPFRCAQILINLCGNAVKFSQKSKVNITVSRDQKNIMFKVKDEGIGIEKEVLAGLFDPFSQADASTARKFGGTGLGLAISKQLSSLLGGELSAISTKGKGSTFTLSLPYFPGKAPESPALADTSVLSGKKVLIAEDNPVNLKLVTHILANSGLYTDSAIDGKAALTKATKNKYDFILMDMQMPELSGTEATLKIRELGFNQPIIALTANASASDREACLNAGMNDFLAKPIEQQQLLKKLVHWSHTIESSSNAALH
ncbi:MAG: response regulator [Pseudohongiellaceae bacterium]